MSAQLIRLFFVVFMVLASAFCYSLPSPPPTYSFILDSMFADEPIATRTSVAVDMTLPGHVTTISNQHGNYTSLALVQSGQASLYLIYPGGGSMVCSCFSLPSLPPFPRLLSSDILTAAGFKPKGLQPLRDDMLQQMQLQISQYWLQAFTDSGSGLAAAALGLDFMGSQFTFSGYSFEKPPQSLFAIPAECGTSALLSLHLPDLPSHHFLSTLPLQLSPTAASAAHAALPALPPPSSPRPSSMDWRQHGMVTPVRNQGACGCCWAKSSVAAMETNAAVAASSTASAIRPLQLSTQYLIDCAVQQQQRGLIAIKGCFGGWPADAMNFSRTIGGLPLEQDYSYSAVSSTCPTRPLSLYSAPKAIMSVSRGDEDAIADAVAQHGAVSVIVETLQDFSSYSGGVYNNSACVGKTLNHAVTIIGYGQTDSALYWIIKNSFGRAWGEDGGYMRMVRGVNMCGIANFAVVPVYQ